MHLAQAVESDSSLQALCKAAAGVSPLPMAAVQGDDHRICFANAAFCLLIGVSRDDLLGSPFAAMAGASSECFADLDLVYSTGEVRSRSAQATFQSQSQFAAYAMWPLLGTADRPLGVMIQITESSLFRRQAMEVNEALLLSSLRAHEAAGKLNEQIRVEAIERNMTLAALIKSEKLASVGRMAAAMAHEINNPLEAVTNTLYLARTTPGLPESACQFLDMADSELHRIAHITRQTLGFYRESSQAESFPVAVLMDSVFHLLRAKINSSGAHVLKRVEENLTVCAHFGELRQVFSNLLLNSLDAVVAGGTVSIRASSRTDLKTGKRRAWITVADDGQGIPASVRHQIFEPFFTTKGSIGNGLGLWVTCEIVTKHAGSIRIHSRTEAPRRGTTFAVLLPLAA